MIGPSGNSFKVLKYSNAACVPSLSDPAIYAIV